jgi:hypothetical protein
MSWTPAHSGFAKRSLHEAHCESTPSTCSCPGAIDLWALNDEEIPLTAGTGKWMFFCGGACEPDLLWSLVAEATRDGKLGWGTKMALKDRANPALMCFTADHEDEADRERVRLELRDLLLHAGLDAEKVNLRYKTDEATAAGLYSREDVDGRGGRGRAAGGGGGRGGGGGGWGGGGGGGGGAYGHVSSYYDVSERCRFIDTPRGCLKGAACKYSHD